MFNFRLEREEKERRREEEARKQRMAVWLLNIEWLG